MSYYVVCRAVTSFREIEEMEEKLILPTFRRLRFVDGNRPFFRKLMHRAFLTAKADCDRWHDYEMTVAPYYAGDPGSGVEPCFPKPGSGYKALA